MQSFLHEALREAADNAELLGFRGILIGGINSTKKQEKKPKPATVVVLQSSKCIEHEHGGI